jgi:hypothetical protein
MIELRNKMTVDLNFQLSTHFKLWEFVTSQIASRQEIDNTPSPDVIEHLQVLCQNILEPAWNTLGRIKILSGYYSPELSRVIGTDKDFSQGYAAEIIALETSNQNLADWLQDKSNFDRIILTLESNEEIASIYVSYSPTGGRKLISRKQDRPFLTNVGRVPVQRRGKTTPLRDPYIQDDDAVILAAEDFTVSINTISDQLYKKYANYYKARQYGNNYFAVMSQMGLGDAEKPILKAHYLEHIDRISSVIRSIWAENVAVVEDFQKDEKSERLYLAFSSFCQGLGRSPLEQVVDAFKQVNKIVGGAFPSLIPYTSIGTTALEGASYIVNTILDDQYKPQVKTVEFTLYPAQKDSSPNIGEAPLQTGAYVLFFEEVNLDHLQMEGDGTVTSIHNELVSPYIVINIEKGKKLAPGQIEKQLAIELLETYNKSYGGKLIENGVSASYFDALEELGKTLQLASTIKRYSELKRKGIQRSEPEENRLQILSSRLKDNSLIDFE